MPVLPALAGAVSTALLAASTVSTVGAPGIGDPYYPLYGNGGYDVSHYDLALSFAPSTDLLSGRATITARTTQELSRFDLDLELPASRVLVDGTAASFTHSGHELVVTPAHLLPAGHTTTIQVTYAGVPTRYSDHGISPWVHHTHETLAVGEPEIAAWWFPSNDHPRDKATFDVTTTAPAAEQVLGNGKLVSHVVHGSTGTWHWREALPMATYLAFLAVGSYHLEQHTIGTRPEVLAWPSGSGTTGSAAAAVLRRTPEVVEFEQHLWGPYPFDALGGVATRSAFGFSLENQTRPLYEWRDWSSGDVYTLVHELSHSWFGDSVSLEDWKDIWLNEGFATYTTWAWSEDHGSGTRAQLFARAYAAHDAGSSFWKIPVGDPGAGREFSRPVYVRGAMTLHALELRVGSTYFYRIMRGWVRVRRYGTGSVAQFERYAALVSHQDLGSFFQHWLVDPVRPAPTRANGFPSGFSARRTTTAVPIRSWDAIARSESD